MVIAYLIEGWNSADWAAEMRALDPTIDVRVWPDCGNVEEIDYALVWKPKPGELRKFPRLKAIFSLGAGVDHVLSDPELPRDVPLVRVVDPDLTMRMTEYVVLHVLWHHRRQRVYDQFQKEKVWRNLPQPPASDVRVGIMGLGVLGTDAATKLRDLGFRVAGWSQTRKTVDGIESFAGEAELEAFLNRTDILVCLLPLTPQTRGILDRRLFSRLARDGAGDGPVLINAGRGGLQVERDIIDALDSGDLHAATLDVFESEPLPPSSPLWTHPRVTVTPHNAADSDARSLSRYVLGQMRRHQAGKPLENVVDLTRHY